VGALVIARRKKDEKHQKAVKNLRWALGTGLGGLITWHVATWATGYVDRVQKAAEVRDAAFVTAMAEMTEKIGSWSEETGKLSTQIVAMRSLAIGAKKLPDCPACVCPKCPAAPACPQSPAVIVQFPGEGQAPASPPHSPSASPSPYHPDHDRNR
jgi:hypothetical protein